MYMYNLPHTQCNQPKKLICHLKSVSHTQYWWDLMDLWVYTCTVSILISIAKLKSSFKTIITFIAIMQLFVQVHFNKWQKVFPVPISFFCRTSWARFLENLGKVTVGVATPNVKMHFYLCHNIDTHGYL